MWYSIIQHQHIAHNVKHHGMTPRVSYRTLQTLGEQNAFRGIVERRVIPHPFSSVLRHAFLRRDSEKIHRSAIKGPHEGGPMTIDFSTKWQLSPLVEALHVGLHSDRVIPARGRAR